MRDLLWFHFLFFLFRGNENNIYINQLNLLFLAIFYLVAVFKFIEINQKFDDGDRCRTNELDVSNALKVLQTIVKLL
jgi:hypothetical protein